MESTFNTNCQRRWFLPLISPETDHGDIRNAELNDAEANDAEINDAEIHDAEINDAEANNAEIHVALSFSASLISATLIKRLWCTYPHMQRYCAQILLRQYCCGNISVAEL